jgi:hypothetical protein
MNPHVEQDKGQGDQYEAIGRIGRGGPAAHLACAPIAGLNGLITNDKFCMSRMGRLKLSWSRYPLRLRGQAMGQPVYPPDESSRRGGSRETPMDNSPADETISGRAAAVGSRLPVPSAMGQGKRARKSASPTGSSPSNSGGVS